MVNKLCDECGMKLRKVQGQFFCSNHGFMEVNQQQSKSENKETPTYIQ